MSVTPQGMVTVHFRIVSHGNHRVRAADGLGEVRHAWGSLGRYGLPEVRWRVFGNTELDPQTSNLILS